MAEYTGKVERISERAGKGKKPPYAPYVQFGFLVEGTWHNVFLSDENEEMLRAIGDGDTVKIQTVKKGEYENVDTIERLSKAPSTDPAPKMENAPVATATQVAKSVSRLDDKDFRITYLACRRDAVNFVIAAYTQGLLPLPTKKTEQADRLYEYVQQYALRFAFDSWNARPVDVKPPNVTSGESFKAVSTANKLEE